MTEREPIPKVNCGKCAHFILGNKNNACAKLEDYRAKGANVVMLRRAFVELGSIPFLPDALRICLKFEEKPEHETHAKL